MIEEQQRIFDIVSKHLIKQGERATRFGFAPCLKTFDGKRCAIGILIPDEEYSMKLEGKSISEILKPNPSDYHGFWYTDCPKTLKSICDKGGKKMIFMLSKLEKIHDQVDPQNWTIELQKCSKDLGLEFNGGK